MQFAKHQNRGNHKSWVPQPLPHSGAGIRRTERSNRSRMTPSSCWNETSQVWKFQFGAAIKGEVIELFTQFSKALLGTYLLRGGCHGSKSKIKTQC